MPIVDAATQKCPASKQGKPHTFVPAGEDYDAGWGEPLKCTRCGSLADRRTYVRLRGISIKKRRKRRT